MTFEKFTWTYLVQETDLDVYGHINNANYVRIFENARWAIVTPRGLGFKDILKSKLGPVILGLDVKFIKEVTAREEVQIETQVMDFRGKIGHIRQVMLKPEGVKACEAMFTFGFFDLKARKLVAPEEKWLVALGGAK